MIFCPMQAHQYQFAQFKFALIKFANHACLPTMNYELIELWTRRTASSVG